MGIISYFTPVPLLEITKHCDCKLLVTDGRRLTLEECGLYGGRVEEGTAEEDQHGAYDHLAAAAGPGLPLQAGQVAAQLLHPLQHVHVAPSRWIRICINMHTCIYIKQRESGRERDKEMERER